MDIIHTTIISKLIKELSTKIKKPAHIGLVLSIYLLYRSIPDDFGETVRNWFTRVPDDVNESCVVISTHKRFYTCVGTREIRRNMFSMRFKGLNYYLIHCRKSQLSNLVEIVRHEYDAEQDTHENYILLPHNRAKFQICAHRNIWIETIIQNDTSSADDDNNNNSNIGRLSKQLLNMGGESKSNDQTYVYRLTTPDKGRTEILETFIDECIEKYKQSMVKDKSQKIFELVRSQKDDNDKIRMIYSVTNFKSNKYLDRNLFYPEVGALTQYVDRFPRKDDPDCAKNAFEEEYERMGVTYKCVLLLHGKPGTGKSGTIKGILNRTGRHGILVRWTKIKSCAEFISLFSNISINDLTYSLREVCFIFEDFDANASRVLKTRKGLTSNDTNKGDQDSDCDEVSVNPITDHIHDIVGDYDLANDFETIMSTVSGGNTATNALVKRYKKNLKKMSTAINSVGPNVSGFNSLHNDDVLSLECVLNTMDGVKELKDAMVIFTTNHIEDIDPAFIRPGRIDKIIQLKFATVDTICAMLCHRFEMDRETLMGAYGEPIGKMKDEVLSPADVQSTIFTFERGEIKECVDRLVSIM